MPGRIQERLCRKWDLSGHSETFSRKNIKSGACVIIIVSKGEEWEYFTMKEDKRIITFLKIIKFLLQT